jgi:UDP:flavonoid glycosyltransferase YjiC (YdhE family)
VRVLFASTQGAGHFGPLIPFIEACRRHGHEILVVGPPTLDARGYPFRAGAVPPPEVLGPLWEQMPSLPPGQGDVVVVGVIFARLNVEAMLPTMTAAIEEWRPDVVVRESAEFASAAAAEAHGLPHVRVSVSLSYLEELWLATAAPALDQHRVGLAGRIAESPYLTLFPAALDPPAFDLARFRDPAATASAPPPDWLEGDLPLVYVSFGSVAGSFPPAVPVFGHVLEAVAELPVRVLLSTGGHDLALEAVPSNVRVERWVQEAELLPHAAAAVGHGGTGTTLRALAAGCPLVVVPLFGDQPQNAGRVAAAGAGVVATIDGIRDSIELVLEHDGYRAAAKRIAEEMQALPPADDALVSLGG